MAAFDGLRDRSEAVSSKVTGQNTAQANTAYADRGKILLGIAAIFMLLLVLSSVLSRGIVRPVEALARASRALALGRQDFPEPPRTAAAEIQDLYADFARMAEAIERAGPVWISLLPRVIRALETDA